MKAHLIAPPKLAAAPAAARLHLRPVQWLLLGLVSAAALPAATFTPLVPVPPPAPVIKPEDTNGSFPVTHLFDNNPATDFASRDRGTNTVVEMAFAQPVRIAAIRHVDRNDPATIARSEMDFFDEAGQKLVTVSIAHANQPSGETLFVLPTPVVAAKAKWRVTEQGNKSYASLGGADLSFYAAEPDEAAPNRDTIQVRLLPFLDRQGQQPVQVTLVHPYVQGAEVSVRLGSGPPRRLQLRSGSNKLDWPLASPSAETALPMTVHFDGQAIINAQVKQTPVRPMTVYILPHSHTDIGYTEIQTAVETKQVQNLVDGLAAARRTAGYPEGSRFVWNVEVGWAADLYLHRMSDAQRADFFQAVKSGQVVLNGMYLNELTGLCRPEELVQLFRFATRIAAQTGVPIDAAMISDVPGYTWGTVAAMAQAGIKYFSAAPNYFDRIGTIMKEWENKPFYWVGPDGQSQVLVWIPFWGYAMSHIYHQLSPKLVADFFDGLDKRAYPFDVAYVRWSGHGDNAVPDPAICEFVRDWNAQYAWPRFVISGTSEAFRAFEQRYGQQLPRVRGDWTPYWEDGAGSSALQTAQNRASSDRLTQAAALFALAHPAAYPQDQFEDAWRNVLLYSEHTWGAWCSISGPERKETREQWEIKKSYADQAEAQSRQLLAAALGSAPAPASGPAQIELVNTLSWERADLALIPGSIATDRDQVLDERGRPVPSQRLRSGDLAVLTGKIPALAARRYSLRPGKAEAPAAAATARGAILENGIVRVRVDQTTGAIVELTGKGGGNLADCSDGEGLNDFRYLIGDDRHDLQRNGPVTISPGESGPLVASLIVESAAPGCQQLRRELRLIAGQDYVEVINHVDKARLESTNYFAKSGKESLNFAFPFNVADGDMLVDLPIGAFQPEAGQIPSACKDWLTVGRWVDVANAKHGVTWVTLDAPLIEVGYLSATMLNSQTNPEVWRKRIDKTQRLYSWAMNNHWGTNYRAYQDGPIVFRFILRPHPGKTLPAEATRFATGFSQPLLVAAAAARDQAVEPNSSNPAGKASSRPLSAPLFTLSSPDVIVTGLKPADDGRGWIVRLYGASDKAKDVKLSFADSKPVNLFFSDTSEKRGQRVARKVTVPAYGLVTLRAENE